MFSFKFFPKITICTISVLLVDLYFLYKNNYISIDTIIKKVTMMLFSLNQTFRLGAYSENI